jgi:uncharacterized membrane protein HdeD (DUF308 family)
MTNRDAPEQNLSQPDFTDALAALATRQRQVVIVGAALIAIGSAMLAFLGLSQIPSIVPVGGAMMACAVLELGIGHHARSSGVRSSPWDVSGSLLALAALVVMISPLLPSLVFSTLGGLLVAGAGWVRLRASTLINMTRKSAILPISASSSILIGILLFTRWGAGDMTATGGLLALDLVVAGWGLVGLGVSLKRLTTNS